MKKKNLRWTLVVVGVVLAAVFLIPLPYRVMCTLEVKPRDAEPVYVDVPGRLEEIEVKAGQSVDASQNLARLSSIDLDVKLAELKGQKEQYEAQLDNLMRASHDDEAAGNQIAQVQESLTATKEQLAQKLEDQNRLRLKAPIAGTVLPPPEVPPKNLEQTQGQLATWSGTPLLPRNVGATLTESVLFCQIGDPRKLEAVLIVDQDDIEFLSPEQSVAIKLDELPGRTFHSKIEEIAMIDLKVSPRSLSNKTGGELITKTDAAGMERPQNTSYQAKAYLPIDEDGLLFIGLRGHAKVSTRWQTLAARGWRYLSHTFNFKL